MKTLAIIPARSGSKGVKDKNIKALAGKPLMAYTIEAAIKSGVFDEVMVSTDSSQYAEIAKRYGAHVPFLRSVENACDTASSWDMIKEVLNKYSENGEAYDAFCLLQPTSPLRDSQNIRDAFDVFREKSAVAVISVCESEHSPEYCGHLNQEGSLDAFIARKSNVQRQALDKYYRLNGAIYWVNVEEFEKDMHLYRNGSYAYIMDNYKSVDIDSQMDFEYAEFLVKKFE